MFFLKKTQLRIIEKTEMHKDALDKAQGAVSGEGVPREVHS